VFRILHYKELFRRNNNASRWRIYSELRGPRCAAKLEHIRKFCYTVQGIQSMKRSDNLGTEK